MEFLRSSISQSQSSWSHSVLSDSFDPMDYSRPGSSGILQVRILEYSCPPPGDLPDLRTETTSPASPAL